MSSAVDPGADPGVEPAADPEVEPAACPAVVLVGPPGAGKTTVAQVLGQRLGIPVRDTDRDVEAAAGVSIADIFLDQGESAFRDRERVAVLAAIREHDGVLAVGGGAVMDPLVEEALRGHRVVFLDVGVSDAARRIGFNRDRPVLIGNPRAQWLRLMQNRRPVYERVGPIRVDTDGRTPDQVADAVLEALRTVAGQP